MGGKKDPTSSQPASFVISSMIRALPDGRRLRFNMCDTVIFGNGRVVAHSFTNKGGEVVKKKGQNTNRDSIREKVRDGHAGFLVI